MLSTKGARREHIQEEDVMQFSSYMTPSILTSKVLPNSKASLSCLFSFDDDTVIVKMVLETPTEKKKKVFMRKMCNSHTLAKRAFFARKIAKKKESLVICTLKIM